MIPLAIDPDGLATIAAAEGQAALASGDTLRAREKYAEAGAHLERRIVSTRKQADKDLLRFLAASQYYRGGRYADAQRLSRQVQVNLLPPDVRPMFSAFVKDVNARADSGYEGRIRAELLHRFQRKDFPGILDILREHPYVLPPGVLAFLRATTCEEVKDYRAAVLFYADAIRHAPEDPGMLYASAAVPITLTHEGKLDEAWRYVEHQLRTIPHALTSINASLVRCHQARRAATDEERRFLSEEQIRHFQDAWRQFQLLPANIQLFPEIREFMALCFEAAAFAYWNLNQPEAALAACDQAIALWPSSPSPRTVRGFNTYPSPQAIEDFREAIRLGETNYIPFYFLAHAAFVRKDYREAAEWSRRALRANPSPRIRAQMLMVLAITKAHVPDEDGEVLRYSEEARELDPQDPWIQHNWRVIREAVAKPDEGPDHHWQEIPVAETAEEYVSKRERSLSDSARRQEAVRFQELVGPAK